MAYTTLLVMLSLLHPKVIALQTSANRDDRPCSFLSADKLSCAQATERTAIDALKHFKSMPRGKLYNSSEFFFYNTCADLGYKLSNGEDKCYPGLHTFFRTQEEGEQYFSVLEQHMKQMGESEGLTGEDAKFLDVCKCKEKSYAKNVTAKLYNKSCDDSHPSSFVSTNKQFCGQASISDAADALKAFKSMPRGKSFDGAILNLHKSCSEMGFTQSGGWDPCFPKLHIFYQSMDAKKEFNTELQNHLNEFGKRNDLTSQDAKFLDACGCQEKSFARNNTLKMFNKTCDNSHPSSFVSTDKLFCAEAPQSFATDALKQFKSMPRGKLYDGTMLNLHKSCTDLGYNDSDGEDPCYPGLDIFYHNKEHRDDFHKKLQDQFDEFGKKNGLTSEAANFMDSCKCQEKSYTRDNIVKMFNRQCDKLSSFVSANELFCAQAPESIAMNALKVFKSMPRGKLYNGVILNLQQSCTDLGYNESAGEDPCYPGLETFYRNKKESEDFHNDLQDHWKDFGRRNGLTMEDANFLDVCKCHERSSMRNNIVELFNKSCGNSRPSSFVSRNKMFCAQGPQRTVTDALNLFKGMPRGKLYENSTVNLYKPCTDLGYNEGAGEDPCYPGLETFYRNKTEGEKFYDGLQDHLKEFGKRKHLKLEDARLVDTCSCQDQSYAKNNIKDLFNKSCPVSRLSSFISKDKLFCAQGADTIAPDALARLRSMPRHSMYDGTKLWVNKSCAELGYYHKDDKSSCYPGLETFYNDQNKKEYFEANLQSHLREYGRSKHLSLRDATFLDGCMCQENDFAIGRTELKFKKSCEKLKTASFVSKSEKYCAQAPISTATAALDYLQSMPRGSLFQLKLNIHNSCSDLGFTRSVGQDPCVPELHTFYRNKAEVEDFFDELQNRLAEFGKVQNLTIEEANFQDICQCQTESYAKSHVEKMFKKSCSKATNSTSDSTQEIHEHHTYEQIFGDAAKELSLGSLLKPRITIDN